MKIHFAAIVFLLCMPILRAEDAPPAPAPVPAPGSAPRILDGTQTPASSFPTVGIVTDAAGSFLASGTLIGPRLVLTAGHCCIDNNGKKLPDNGGRFLLNGVFYPTSRIITHPSFNNVLIGEDNIVDLGIFELQTPLAVPPSPIRRTAAGVGETLSIAGYGKLGSGRRGIEDKFPEPGQISSGTATIDDVTAINLAWVFESGESGTAPGDSGGPSFIGGEIAGVHSLGIALSARNFGKFGTVDKDARVDTSAQWIDSILSGASSNNPPVVTTPASASPATLGAGQMVQFSVGASDPDGTNLLYLWDFGDGTAAQGPAQAHTYLFPGTYAATVTVSDNIDALVLPVPVTVNADSVSALTLKKLQLSVNFQRDASDGLSISGTLSPLPASFGGFAKIDVGGAQAFFPLDERGRGRGTLGNFSINARTGVFSASLRRADFSGFWPDEGIVNATTSASITMPVQVAINGFVYNGSRTLAYTAKQDRSGKAR